MIDTPTGFDDNRCQPSKQRVLLTAGLAAVVLIARNSIFTCSSTCGHHSPWYAKGIIKDDYDGERVIDHGAVTLQSSSLQSSIMPTARSLCRYSKKERDIEAAVRGVVVLEEGGGGDGLIRWQHPQGYGVCWPSNEYSPHSLLV